ncbi:DUF4123 domain-containing protein [Achromobacter mucicolens]|uniref:DUF4123 domain-containing protein n=1 Tax=Achromobacter mucicolens TaxID=1389922 RepID=UPI0022F396F6|nr:DUF4123 domain-containing protein [Achromobacter mucicolens]WBX87278.1 DUF4123 domain-containing protein [Achromobacter mucicolens]
MSELSRKLITELSAPGPQRHLIAVSDIAGLDDSMRHAVNDLFGGRCYPLLQNEKWAALRPYSPLLLAARSTTLADCGNLMEAFHGRLLNALQGWIISTQPADALATHLSDATLARGPDGCTYLLRYYDPLVLPILHQRADPGWWNSFVAPIVSWWVPGANVERRLWSRVPGNGDRAGNTFPLEMLTMDADLWQALAEDPFPHRLLREAQTHEPSLFDTDCRYVRLARVRTHLKAAEMLGLSSSEDLHDYVFMALSRPAQQLRDDSQWQLALQMAASGNGRLGAAYLALVSQKT